MSKNKIHAMKFISKPNEKNGLTHCGKLMRITYLSSNIDEITCLKCLNIMRNTLKFELNVCYGAIGLIDLQLTSIGGK